MIVMENLQNKVRSHAVNTDSVNGAALSMCPRGLGTATVSRAWQYKSASRFFERGCPAGEAVIIEGYFCMYGVKREVSKDARRAA